MREINYTIKDYFRQIAKVRATKRFDDREQAYQDAYNTLAPGVDFEYGIVVMVKNQADKLWEEIDRAHYENATNWVRNSQNGLFPGQSDFDEPEFIYKGKKKVDRRKATYADKIKNLEKIIERRKSENESHADAIKLNNWVIGRAENAVQAIHERMAWLAENGYDAENMTDEEAEAIFANIKSGAEYFPGGEARV